LNLSVVIPSLNAADTIAIQLEALVSQSWTEPWEIVIADNGSIDETLTIAEKYRERLPTLRIVDASRRRGPSYARNVGASAAWGDLLVFCDADDEVAPGWLTAMGEALSKSDFVAGYADLSRLNPPRLLQNKRKLKRNGVIANYLNYLPAASTWGIGIKRSIHKAVGGFDEAMLRLQDIDYCWRIQLMGVKLTSVPEAIVYYRYPHTLSDIYRKAYLDGMYQIFLYKRYGPLGMPQLPLKVDINGLRHTIRQLPKIRYQQNRIAWLRRFGYYVGRLRGRFKYQMFSS